MKPDRDDLLLVINAGSSSLKFAVYASCSAAPVLRLRGAVDNIGKRPRLAARNAVGETIDDDGLILAPDNGIGEITGAIVEWLHRCLPRSQFVAAGHRVALGSPDLDAPIVVNDELISRLRKLAPLAPLHLPRNLEPIEVLAQLYPDIPQIACFDTAFHRTMPRPASIYALPRDLTDAGVIRYGFHGLSYEYVASKLADIDCRAATGRTVVAHLGSGASMCALVTGKSVATTMGFSPLSGLVMTSRPGDLDAGVVLWLMRERQMDGEALEDLLYRRSGLLGVSGMSGDMRVLLDSDSPRALEAVELFVYRAGRELGSLAAAAGGLDALVFTGGIGENAAAVRSAICSTARWLGIELDERANSDNGPRISVDGSRVSVWVIPTDEETMIARHTLATVTGGSSCLVAKT